MARPRWLHSLIDTRQMRGLLEGQSSGTFLVREASFDTAMLSCVHDGAILDVPLRMAAPGQWLLGRRVCEGCTTLEEVVDRLHSPRHGFGLPLVLTQPVDVAPRTIAVRKQARASRTLTSAERDIFGGASSDRGYDITYVPAL